MSPVAQNQASGLLLLQDLKTTWTKPVLNEADGPFPEISCAATMTSFKFPKSGNTGHGRTNSKSCFFLRSPAVADSTLPNSLVAR